jgi:AraC-like DNA-binding protein
VESFSTIGLPVAQRLAFWSTVASETFTAMDVRPSDMERFYGTLNRERLGPVTVMNVYSSAVRIRHTRAQIPRLRTPSYLLMAPLQRDMELRSEGMGTIRVRPGEFCLIDHARAFDIAHGDGFRTLCVDLPRARLERCVPNVGSLIGRLIGPDSASTRMLLALLKNVANEIGPAGGGGLSPLFGESLLGLVEAACTLYVEPRAAHGTKARAKLYRAYIDSRLTDPDLKPSEVAAHFDISERYLRAVLSAEGESFSCYVLQRRLERCAELLQGQAGSHMTITQIAFQCGFSNATHFGQAFKALFGITPREFRAAAPSFGTARSWAARGRARQPAS